MQWILESRDLHLPISRKMIQRKALSLISPSNPEFKAFEGWLQKFMVRNCLSLRRHTSIQQKLPAALERKLTALLDKIKTLRERHDFSEDLMVNVDETPIFFDMQRACTVHPKGAREVRIRGTKGGKRRVTFTVSCTASGKMLKPMIIYKGKTARTISDIEYNKSNIFITYQEKSWMDESLMLRWIKEVLLKHTKGKHCLLFLDSFRAHITDKVMKSLEKSNVSVAVIPGGCTSKVQPIDVCLNKSIKDIVRGELEWEAFLLEKVEEGDHEGDVGATKTDIAKWIHAANSLLDSQQELVVKSFCGLSNKLDGSENHLIRCAKELPQFVIPYRTYEEESDIFDDSELDADSPDNSNDLSESDLDASD